MPTVNVHEAKTQLSRLLVRAEAGEEVVIARRGEPVARLVACKPKGRRRFGAMKGKIVVGDSILEPLPEEELARWEGGAFAMPGLRAADRGAPTFMRTGPSSTCPLWPRRRLRPTSTIY